MLDRHAPPNRPATTREKRSSRGLRHGAAVAACLVVGFGGGAATAEVWGVPAPGGAGAPLTAEREAPPAPARGETDPASRSAVERAGSTGDVADGPAPLDLLAPRPDAPSALAPSPSPSAPETPAEPVPDAEPTPEAPVAEPGSGLLGEVVVAPDLGGTLVVVPGEAPAPGTGTVRSVRVEVEQGLPVDGEIFATAVLATLNDPRGWSGPDGVTFSRTAADDASIRVVLASPATTDRMCAPLATEGKYSCGNSVSGVAVLNFERWVLGAPDFGDDVATYRQYLVNHEVGHVLGHGHEDCPAPGAVAPVMVQQSISAQGCVTNGWPVP
ncbi:DUF3152 domain-containing protein [Cellulosimicrobium cellulans]|uniref:DUF3152 domain-containing protein n=1 Tax=Cellulosimicrobium cellulans TaxID=1710 RepID=UPI0027DDC0FB|nr:DUF3152 domain-containing protein [Cellulosimicrobium cellulans]